MWGHCEGRKVCNVRPCGNVGWVMRMLRGCLVMWILRGRRANVDFEKGVLGNFVGMENALDKIGRM